MYGNVHMHGSNTIVDGNFVLNKDLDVYGNVTFHGSNLSIESETMINNFLYVLEDVNINSNLFVNRSAYIQKDLEVYGNVYMHGSNLIVDGTTILKNNVDVYGNINFHGSNFQVDGKSVMMNDLEVYGNVILHGSNLIIESETKINNDLYVNGNVYLQGSNLIVDGDTILNMDLDVYGDVTFHGSNLTIESTTMINNSLNVLNDVFVNGSTCIQQDLDVYGNVHFHGSNFVIDGETFINNNLHVLEDASFSSNIFVYGTTLLESNLDTYGDVHIHGSNLIVDSETLFNNLLFAYNNVYFNSNLEVSGDVAFNGSNVIINSHTIINSNLDITGNINVHGSSIFNCNLNISGKLNVKDSVNITSNLLVYGDITISNSFGMQKVNNSIFSFITNGNYTLSATPPPSCACSKGQYITWSNIQGDSYAELDGTQIVGQNLYVGGCVFAEGINAECLNVGTFQFQTQELAAAIYCVSAPDETMSNNMIYWTESVDILIPGKSGNLVFKSINNSEIVFTDDFEPSVLNFTGSHRLVYQHTKNTHPYPGMIVSSTGKYMNLDDVPTCLIDEALPIVSLSKKEKDKRVFGVIKTLESDANTFKIGSIEFQRNALAHKRAIIQSSGEGLIWVTGNIKNGDLICSSALPGYGRKQDCDFVKNISIAKATCCYKNAQEAKIIIHKNKTYKCFLIGCVYLL